MRWKTCWMNGRDSRRAPADFSMFNDFAIQLSIISFIKSCQAHRYTLASMGGQQKRFHSHTGGDPLIWKTRTSTSTSTSTSAHGPHPVCQFRQSTRSDLWSLTSRSTTNEVINSCSGQWRCPPFLQPPLPWPACATAPLQQFSQWELVSSVSVRSFDRSAVAAVVDIGVYVIIFILTWSPAAAHPVNVRKN